MLGRAGSRRRPDHAHGRAGARRGPGSGSHHPAAHGELHNALSFDHLGLSPDLRGHRGRGGLRDAHPCPGPGHPPRPRRQRRPRRRADRHRQDRRLHPPDPRPAPRPREHLVLAGPASRPLSGARADARAGDPGRRIGGDLRPAHPAAKRGRVRRRPPRPADQGAPGRHRDPGRHAGPTAGPRRAAGRQPRPGRDPRPRRGRPHARHGLHARHPAHPRAPAGPPAEPALLGHDLRGDQAAVGTDPARPLGHRGRPPRHRRRGRPPARLSGRSRPQGRAAGAPRPSGRLAAGARVHAHQAHRLPPRVLAGPTTDSPRRRSTATGRRATGPRRSRRSRRARSASSSRPTSRPAASTSRTCPTS